MGALRPQPTASLLEAIVTSPRRGGYPRRAVHLLFPALLVAVLLFSPETTDRLHCTAGRSSRCANLSPAHAVFRSTRFDHTAARASCVPRREGGKVVFVTGAAGFIGFAASSELRARGDGVLGLDNFNDYYPVSLKEARATELARAGVHTVRGDVNDGDLLARLFAVCRPTHVLHLAAQAGVRYAAIQPLSYIESNVRATTILLETVRAQKPIPHLIYASSSSVYGKNSKVPFSESDRVDQPSSLYAATKREGELLATVYHGLTGMSVTGLRFFTVYGPWGRPDMAALAFAHRIAQGQPIRIFLGPGDTELARDFTYIDDIVKGVLGAIDSAAAGDSRIFNLGNTHPHTVSDFVDTLEKALDKKAIRNPVALPKLGDVMQTHSNITLANQVFGYAPAISLEDGLQRFADWFYAYYGPNGTKLHPDERTYVPL